jgi:WD40 repeat protein
VDTGKELDRSPLTHAPEGEGAAHKLSRVPDSPRFLATVSAFDAGLAVKKVRLWEVAGNKLRSRPLFAQSIRGGVRDFCVTPDGRRALALGFDHSLWEWDLNDNRLLRQIPALAAPRFVWAAAIAPDSRHALLARKDQPFAEIDLRSGQETARWKEAVAGFVTCLAFSPNSRQVLSGGQDGKPAGVPLELWNVKLAGVPQKVRTPNAQSTTCNVRYWCSSVQSVLTACLGLGFSR